MSVLLIDVDHFKQINDAGGHALGDQVLIGLAERLQAQLRLSDRLGRWGGEEFLIMAAATSLAAASDLAERIRRAASATPCAGRDVTLSLGVAQCRPDDTIDSVVQRADRALYAAKANGRNRVCLEEPATRVSPSGSSA